MSRGRPRRKERMVSKNITLRETQIKTIEKIVGKEGNFSEILRKIVDLYLSILDLKLITDLSDESITKVLEAFSDAYSKRKVLINKVLEYPDIFEQLAKNARYFLPDISSLIELFVPIMESYNFLDISKMKPKDLETLRNVSRQSNMFDEMELAFNPIVITFKGKNPYTMLWYSKVLSMAVCHFKSHYKIQQVDTNLNKTIIKITFVKGESKEEALQAIEDHFNSTEKIVSDPEDNVGAWNLINTHFNAIIDKQFLELYLKSLSNGVKINLIPYLQVIERIKSKNKVKTGNAVLQFYEKLHLISHFDMDKKVASFTTSFEELVLMMLKKTYEYLAIKYNIEKRNEFLILSFL